MPRWLRVQSLDSQVHTGRASHTGTSEAQQSGAALHGATHSCQSTNLSDICSMTALLKLKGGRDRGGEERQIRERKGQSKRVVEKK